MVRQKFYVLLLLFVAIMYATGCSNDNETISVKDDNVEASNTEAGTQTETGSETETETGTGTETGTETETDIETDEPDDSDGGNGTDATETVSDSTIVDDLDIDEDDTDYIVTANTDSITYITFNGTTIDVIGGGADVSGDVVTITMGFTYSVSGTGEGQIVVNSEDENVVKLVLNDANITCSDCAPIYVEQSERTVIILKEGTSNTLTDGSNYTFIDTENEEPDAALFSKDDLSISGEGSLTVTANYKDGITTKDGLIINSGNITVNAADDGIKGKDYLLIEGGDVSVNAGGDGLKSTNDEDPSLGYIYINDGTLSITSDAEAIQAYTKILVNGGDIDIVTGGGVTTQQSKQQAESNSDTEDTAGKGFKADIITVNGGTIDINSCRDGIHGDVKVTIAGGEITIAAYDDGVHCDDSLVFNGGITTVTEAFEGVEAEVIIVNDPAAVNVYAYDDGFNGQSWVIFNGGTTTVEVSGNDVDAIDSNGSIAVNGGTIYVIVDGKGESFDADGSKTLSTEATVFVDGTQITEFEAGGMQRP